MSDVLNKDLVMLKQRLELLQSTYVFFTQCKVKESFREQLLNQIERDMEQLVNKTATLTRSLKVQ